MRKKEIENRLYDSIQEAPINQKNDLIKEKVNKMKEHDYITKQENEKKKFFNWKPFAAVASVLLIFFAGYFGYYTQYRAVDSIVYLDVNPSVEISTNKQDKVLSIRALNDDAEDYLEGFKFKGKYLNTVSIELIDRFLEKGYLNESNNTILISIQNDNEEKSKEQKNSLNEKVNEYLKSKNIKPLVLTQSIRKDDTTDSSEKTYRISEGRLIFIEKLIRANPEFKIKDLVSLSLEELVTLAEKNNINVGAIIDSYYENDNIDNDDFYDDDDMEDESKYPTDLISKKEATKIALDKVGGGKITEIELNEDDGIYEYEIKIEFNGYEYELDINAKTGEVLYFEKDKLDDDYDDNDDDMDDDFDGDDMDDEDDSRHRENLMSRKEAINKALERVGGGKITEIDLDEDDGKYKYEIKVEFDGYEYELEIDGKNGKILKFEKDESDDNFDEDDDDMEDESKYPTDLISKKEATKIALDKVGGGKITEIELNEDDGIYEYEIKIEFNGYEYELDINAKTGEVLYFEKDKLDDDYNDNDDDMDDDFDGDDMDDEDDSRYRENLMSRKEAINKALKRVGGGKITEVDLDEDDGKYKYEIKVEFDGYEYELEINGKTGKILKFEKDESDDNFNDYNDDDDDME